MIHFLNLRLVLIYMIRQSLFAFLITDGAAILLGIDFLWYSLELDLIIALSHVLSSDCAHLQCKISGFFVQYHGIRDCIV